MNRVLLYAVLCIFFSIVGISVLHAQAVLFEDHFSSGNFKKWGMDKDMASHWSVEKSILGSSAVGKGLAFMSAGSNTWSNYNLKLRVKVVQGTFEVAFRCGDTGRYYIHYNPLKKQLSLMKHITQGKRTELVSAAVVIQPGQWATVAIDALGPEIKISVNGVSILEHKDNDPLPNGGIQLIALDKSLIDFGNITVTGLAG